MAGPRRARAGPRRRIPPARGSRSGRPRRLPIGRSQRVARRSRAGRQPTTVRGGRTAGAVEGAGFGRQAAARTDCSGAGSPGGEVPMSRRVRSYIGLGANVGDAQATLTDAVAALGALPGTRLRGVSRLYRTTPVGGTDQPDFLNGVVALDAHAG